MDYRLYTTVDITRTGQYRNEPGKELERLQEQNFNTVVQTIGIRSNVLYTHLPKTFAMAGTDCGMEFSEIIKIWRFDFSTDIDFVFEKDNDPVKHLVEMFDSVPYITGLNEDTEQRFAVFATVGPYRNISFFQR